MLVTGERFGSGYRFGEFLVFGEAEGRVTFSDAELWQCRLTTLGQSTNPLLHDG